MIKNHSLDMTEGSVTKKLLLFALPILLSSFLQHLYTIADRVVVGNFAADGITALAAVGATSSATNLLLNLFNGISIGVNVVCSNLRGSRKHRDLQRCMHTAMLLSAVFGVALAVIGVLLAPTILTMMKTPTQVLPSATDYMRIYFMGMPASLVYNFGAAILRSHGDSRRSMYILGMTGIVNVVLNLVFVIGLGLDVKGVAIATISAQYLSAAAVLWILFCPKEEYKLRWAELAVHTDMLKKLVAIGVPCGINGILQSASNVVIQSSVNAFGSADIIAGSTAATDINNFSYLVNGAFSSACVSFSGQCYGARKYKRIDKLIVSSIATSVPFLVVIGTLVTVFRRELLGIFNPDPNVVEAGVVRLLLCTWGNLFFTVNEAMVGCVRGMGKSLMPTVLNVFCLCGVRLLWALVIFPLLPYEPAYLFLCFPVSWIIGTVVHSTYFFHCRKQLRKAV